MAENRQYITQIQEKGNVLISEDVISTIVTHAVCEVEGVANMQFTGKKGWGKNIRIAISPENVLTIDCNIVIIYGQSVVTVAQTVQTAVTAAIEAMTGVKIAAVNVNVCGIARN